MAAPQRPDGIKYYLRSKWIIIPKGAYDPDAASLALLTGATALDVTKMLYDSSAKPSQTTNLVKAPKRVGDGETYERVGENNPSIGEIRYAVNPQAAVASLQKKLLEKLPPLSEFWLVNRLGPNRDDDLALGEFVTSYPAEAGEQMEVPEGDGEAAEVAIVQTLAQTGPKHMMVEIVA